MADGSKVGRSDAVAQATPAGYMPGFGNDFETEALPGALPVGQNSPQRAAYGLYAEQLSGSPFTAPRGANERSWLYRIRPSVKHTPKFKQDGAALLEDGAVPRPSTTAPIGQLRWGPVPIPKREAHLPHGHAHHDHGGRRQHAGRHGRARLSRHPVDGERLLLQRRRRDADRAAAGRGCASSPSSARIEVEPGEICVIPRGVKFKVELVDGPARGYVCENYGAKFTLPDRGPIGANCLANARDFKTPVAAFEDSEEKCRLTVKWCGGFHVAEIGHSPLDVVAWHGNYAPYKYNLRHYSPVGAILFDHPDPSIFTVLTAPSETAGTANVDFVIFPERWAVAEHTFRPPWYHMNIMSEFMGLIYGVYDAKPEGFVPGGMSLHNCMLPHGPDKAAYDHATKVELKPVKLTNTLAFMFETRFPQHLTKFAAELETLQEDYADCWTPLEKKFTGSQDERGAAHTRPRAGDASKLS